jgi:arsenate reductase-like glutaredoxin family protein
LLEQGAELELRDLAVDRLTAEELDALIGDRDYRMFLNPRNTLYRQRDMAKHPPSRAQAIALMVREPNLIRRPVVISGRRIVLGYDEPALRGLARERKKTKPKGRRSR